MTSNVMPASFPYSSPISVSPDSAIEAKATSVGSKIKECFDHMSRVPEAPPGGSKQSSPQAILSPFTPSYDLAEVQPGIELTEFPYQTFVNKDESSLSQPLQVIVNAPEHSTESRTDSCFKQTVGPTPGTKSKVCSFIKSCWPFSKKQTPADLSAPLLPPKEVTCDITPLEEPTFYELNEAQAPVNATIIDLKDIEPKATPSKTSRCFSAVFGAIKKVVTHPATSTVLALGGIATAAACGTVLHSTVGLVAGCITAGFFSKELVTASGKANRLVERFLGYWGYECVVGTNYLYYYHPTAGIILGGIFAGVSVRQLLDKAVSTIEQRNLPLTHEQELLALIEQGIELEKHTEQPTRSAALINFLKRHWKTILILGVGAALLPSRSPEVLTKIISSLPAHLQLAAVNVYGVFLDMSAGLIAGPAGYHSERKLHQLRLDCQGKTSRLKSVATKIAHFFVGAGRQLLFAAGVAVYVKSDVTTIFTVGMALAAFALGANASERHRRNSLKEKGITLIDLETGQELPRLNQDDLACIENSDCIRTMRTKWDSTSRIARFVRENAGSLFCLAGIAALTASYHVAGFAWDESFQTTSMLAGGIIGFLADRLANNRWKKIPASLNPIQKVTAYLIENFQLEMLFFGLYTTGNGFPVVGNILGSGILGFSVGSNRSIVNAGGRNIHPGAGFVSYKVLTNAVL